MNKTDRVVKIRQKAARLILTKIDILSDKFPKEIQTLTKILSSKSERELSCIVDNSLKRRNGGRSGNSV